MLQGLAMRMLSCWQKLMTDRGDKVEEGRGCNFKHSFGLYQRSSLAAVCCHFTTYDTKILSIWVVKTKLRSRINEVKNIQLKKKNKPISRRRNCFLDRVVLALFFCVGLKLTVKRLRMPVRNILAGSMYLLNLYHINKTVDTTKFRNILQWIVRANCKKR